MFEAFDPAVDVKLTADEVIVRSTLGRSTGGDAVNLFDAAGRRITGVSFGASTTLTTTLVATCGTRQ